MRSLNDTDPQSRPHALASKKPVAPRLAAGVRVQDVYAVERRLKVGGIAEIYVAQHLPTGRYVALKVLQERQQKKPHMVRAFEREARALAKIPRHENLVDMYDAGYDAKKDLHFIALELLLGSDLREEMIARGAFSVVDAAMLVAILAQMLASLHDAGIFHRDLKPENVFIHRLPGKRPVIKLLDLGAASSETTELRTEELRCIGTPLYMSPEQIERGVVSPRSDIYALGLILYELLRGSHPFEDARPSERSVGARQLAEDPEPLVKCVPGIPYELSSIAERMVRKDPNARYASGFTVAEILTDFLRRFRAGVLAQDAFLEKFVLDPNAARRAPDPDVHDVPRRVYGPEVLAATAPTEEKARSGPITGRGTVRIVVGDAAPPAPDAAPLSSGGENEGPVDADGVLTYVLGRVLMRQPRGEAPLPFDSLVIVDGPVRLRGLRFPLVYAAMRVGRSMALADVVVPHVTVSRHHCGIFHVGPGIAEVVDSDSSFGLEVNDSNVTRALLRERGRLRIGAITLVLVRAGDAAPKVARDDAPGHAGWVDPRAASERGPSKATLPRSREHGSSDEAPPTESSPPMHEAPDPPKIAGTRRLVPTAPMIEGGRSLRPPDTALERAPKELLSLASETHDYFDHAQLPEVRRAELLAATREREAASSAELERAVAKGDVALAANALFASNEYAARRALLEGLGGPAVFEKHLRSRRDWTTKATALVEARRKERRKSLAPLVAVVVIAIVTGVVAYVFFVR